MKKFICIFAKPPLPGKTKSRLAKSIGDQAAAELSGIMLQSLIVEASRSGAQEIVLWGSPGSSLDDFKEIDLAGVSFEEQSGQDLGDRMANCFKSYLEFEENQIILIGSDCISHTSELFNHAFNILSNCDVIIQPAIDGGYVLIGQTKFLNEIFKDIPWGGASVFGLTLEKLSKHNYEVLPKAFDVDTMGDLKQLNEFAKANSNKEILSWFQKHSLA